MAQSRKTTTGTPVDIKAICREHARLSEYLGEESALTIERMAWVVTDCLSNGGTVFACGNGGSAAQAEHFAGELLGRFNLDRRALPVFALSDNKAVVTAIANDTAYSRVFSRQLEGLGRKRDCLIALSTSGRSENIIEACRSAKKIGMKVLAFTGKGGGAIGGESDISLKVPSDDTARIQEMHLLALHLICQIVEDRLFGDD